MSQKEAQRRLNARIEAKLNDKLTIDFKTLTFNQTCNNWLNRYIKTSGSKLSTTKTESSYRSISLTTHSCDILRRIMLENKKAIQVNLCIKMEDLYSLIIVAILCHLVPLIEICNNLQAI